MARCSSRDVEFTRHQAWRAGRRTSARAPEVPLARVSSADHGSDLDVRRETAREVEIASVTYLLARSVISARPMWNRNAISSPIRTRRRCVVIRGKGG